MLLASVVCPKVSQPPYIQINQEFFNTQEISLKAIIFGSLTKKKTTLR